MYGIAREAVTNALKHAQAQTIRVELDCSARPAIELSVHDDGRGLDPNSPQDGGLGLRIMDYRAQTIGGSFALETPTTGGSCVRCSLSCPQASAA